MVAKTTGISADWIIHPGETIADVLEDRGITQVELAARTDVTPAYVSSVISGKKDISSKFAAALEYALGVRKSFWLNLQANYEAEKLDRDEVKTITNEEKAAKPALAEIIRHLRRQGYIPLHHKAEDTILSLRKALQISNIDNLKDLVPAGVFRMSTHASVDPHVLGAWLRLCQMAGDQRCIDTPFEPAKTGDLVADLKQIMCDPHCDLPEDLTSLMGRYGIDFSVVRHFRGAPVHGYLTRKKESIYQMVLTIRGAYADIFWFSLFHEIGHIVNGDVAKAQKFIDVVDGHTSEREQAADRFASEALVDPAGYERFLNESDFSFPAIQRFATSQQVMPYIVIGRLQKEKIVPYSMYSSYKVRYRWHDAFSVPSKGTPKRG